VIWLLLLSACYQDDWRGLVELGGRVDSRSPDVVVILHEGAPNIDSLAQRGRAALADEGWICTSLRSAGSGAASDCDKAGRLHHLFTVREIRGQVVVSMVPSHAPH